MKKNNILTLLFSIVILSMSAQEFDVSAEIRPRFESKHGYKSLAAEKQDAANFISQRSRLNFDFNNSNVKLKVSLQNVRVWGDVSTLASDYGAFALHEAWAEAKLSTKTSLKLGRQEIVYDDHRIFGSVGWAQQARSHDAFVFKYKASDNHKLDLGIAMNEDSQAGLNNLYSNAAGYKNFQYAWYHGKFNEVGLSVLLLNTGLEHYNSDSTGNQLDNMQTMGPRFTYKKDKLSANAAFYMQSGKKNDIDVNAMYYAANIAYKISKEFSLGAGLESLSGKDQDDTKAEINSFAPLFGTNHKFNGWMDYFYVGNHGGSVGLTDISATIAYKKDKISAKLIPHFFSSAAKVLGTDGKEMDANLGTEVDFTLGYKINSDVKFNIGYSQMLGTETMERIRGGDKGQTSNWAWIMFTFKPKLFSYKATKKVD